MPPKNSANKRTPGPRVDQPSVVVLDEFPCLFTREANIDAVLQKIWDRHLDQKAPVFLILIGSDLHMMEQLAQYDKPLFGRAREMVALPLSPADIADMTGLQGADALDARTSGFGSDSSTPRSKKWNEVGPTSSSSQSKEAGSSTAGTPLSRLCERR